MAWTSPRTWVAGEVLTAALLNTHLRDNLNAVRVSYGTSLPGSPADGDIAVLVDSTTAPTYQWKFRYNASASGSFKWEFIGGTPMTNSADGAANSAASSGSWSSALGMSITVPRQGDYIIEFGGTSTGNAAGSNGYLGLGLGASPASTTEACQTNNAMLASLSQTRKKTSLAASTVLDLYIQDSDSTRRIAWQQRWLKLTPLRVI